MIRLTWRLARPNVLSSAAVLAALALFAVLTRHLMSADLGRSGLSACLAGGGDCDQMVYAFEDRFGAVINAYGWINLLPPLAGVFWGAPLLAREIEAGTHRLTWTQSIGRGHWLAVRLGMFLAGALALAAGVTALMTWWFGPIERIRVGAEATFGRLNPDVFDFRGVVPIAYTLFAFAVGAAAGTIIRRTVPAMVATLAAYIPLRLAVQALRAHFMTARTVSYPFDAANPRALRGDWILSHATLDGSGRTVDRLVLPDDCRAVANSLGAVNRCLVEHGFRYVDTYQPINRFWPFQLIESGIFVALAAALLALTVWWVLRRVS